MDAKEKSEEDEKRKRKEGRDEASDRVMVPQLTERKLMGEALPSGSHPSPPLRLSAPDRVFFLPRVFSRYDGRDGDKPRARRVRRLTYMDWQGLVAIISRAT